MPLPESMIPLPEQTNHLGHDNVIQWKHFPRYCPLVRGIHRSPVNSPHKGRWRGALMFSLIPALNKRLSKHSWGWWFETPSRLLWRHCNAKGHPWSRYWHGSCQSITSTITVFRLHPRHTFIVCEMSDRFRTHCIYTANIDTSSFDVIVTTYVNCKLLCILDPIETASGEID